MEQDYAINWDECFEFLDKNEEINTLSILKIGYIECLDEIDFQIAKVVNQCKKYCDDTEYGKFNNLKKYYKTLNKLYAIRKRYAKEMENLNDQRY